MTSLPLLSVLSAGAHQERTVEKDLKDAAFKGDVAAVQRLLPSATPNGMLGRSLMGAISMTQHKVIALLLPVFKATPDFAVSHLLVEAVRAQSLPIVRDLIEQLAPFGPMGMYTRAFQEAASQQRADLLKILRPYAKTKDDASLALQNAAQTGNRAIIDELLPYSDARAAFQRLTELGRWVAADQLVDHVGADHRQFVLKKAPMTALPRLRALAAQESLDRVLPEVASKPRPGRTRL